jgi:hypothetical protein
VLVEFHPEREFTLEQLCEAMERDPRRRSRSVYAAGAVADDGTDDVMAWLSDNGLVISNPNQEGWAGVICPNSAEHTDGNPEGRYLPATRAFCCLHTALTLTRPCSSSGWPTTVALSTPLACAMSCWSP